MKNPLVERYGSEKRWVNYKIVEMEGRKTKVPYAVNGRKASSVDPSTWSTFGEAFAKSQNVGIVFTPERNILAIDIDHCLNAKGGIEHELQSTIAELVLTGDTYTEVSPSGDGLHMYFELTGPLELFANRKAPFEAYTEGRYFTVTQRPYGEVRDVMTLTPEAAMRILAIIGYPWAKEPLQKKSELLTKAHGDAMDDTVLLEKMFSSRKNGLEIKSLYEGNISKYKDDNSIADMALLSHLAFWTGKNPEQMERLWLASPLGKREKTEKRKDYRDRSILNAIGKCTVVYRTKAMRLEEEYPELDLLFTVSSKKDTVFTLCTENIARVLQRHPDFAGRFRFDIFRNRMQWKRRNDTWREIGDADMIAVQTDISKKLEIFQKVSKPMVVDAILQACMASTIDSAAEYVKSIAWDGMPRLDEWLCNAYGAPRDEYHGKVGSNWLKGLVSRIINPGCKFDYVLVLEGPQGSKKSTSLAVLGQGWHFETSEGMDNKDFFQQFEGKAIVEFSEGETLSRTEVKRMKAIITTQVDRYRPSYGRFSMDFPRRCVFAMTTNAEEYLKDETGNRRWLPVKVMLPEADVEWIRENRDQLFAEAYRRLVTGGETTWEFPREATLAAQNARRVRDANAEPIEEWYRNRLQKVERDEGITAHQVFVSVLQGGFASKPMGKYDEMSISTVLRDELGLEKRRVMKGGARSYRWFDPMQESIPSYLETEPVNENAARSLQDF